MSRPVVPITESALRLDLNEEAHTLVRELAMACRKTGIYGTDHPLSVKAVEKPYMVFRKLFRFKSCISLNVQHGCLFLLSIRLKDTPFNAQVLQLLHQLPLV